MTLVNVCKIPAMTINPSRDNFLITESFEEAPPHHRINRLATVCRCRLVLCGLLETGERLFPIITCAWIANYLNWLACETNWRRWGEGDDDQRAITIIIDFVAHNLVHVTILLLLLYCNNDDNWFGLIEKCVSCHLWVERKESHTTKMAKTFHGAPASANQNPPRTWWPINLLLQCRGEWMDGFQCDLCRRTTR